MADEKQYKKLLDKVKKATKDEGSGLSTDEDLSVAVMNLASLEEHLFFTQTKTKKEKYLDLLREVREIRKELMGKLVKNRDGEVWCICKHLLSASMRLLEAGTKLDAAGDRAGSKELLSKAYKLYLLFWAVNLNLVGVAKVKEVNDASQCTCRVDEEALISELEEAVEESVRCSCEE